jgi:hypothetical protein
LRNGSEDISAGGLRKRWRFCSVIIGRCWPKCLIELEEIIVGEVEIVGWRPLELTKVFSRITEPLTH